MRRGRRRWRKRRTSMWLGHVEKRATLLHQLPSFPATAAAAGTGQETTTARQAQEGEGEGGTTGRQ